MDGEENVDIRSLSGGEGTSADLAIDLSVVDLIESRCNKGLNFLILDEPFNGLDSVNCEQVLELLKNSGSNKKILVVDHSEQVKAMVESSITVVRTGATSTVTQS
jgi:DNA repair exonuclease SbcCD ATPase subunit